MLGLLRGQVAVTIEGWTPSPPGPAATTARAEALADAEQRGDAAKRSLLSAVRAAFVTPLEPEDVFALSRGLDWILDYARDLVNESQVMVRASRRGDRRDGAAPRRGRPQASTPRSRTSRLRRRRRDARPPTTAIAPEQQLDSAYYRGMGALLEVKDMRERISRRELYRRCARIGEVVIDVAERVVYAIFKGA